MPIGNQSGPSLAERVQQQKALRQAQLQQEEARIRQAQAQRQAQVQQARDTAGFMQAGQPYNEHVPLHPPEVMAEFQRLRSQYAPVQDALVQQRLDQSQQPLGQQMFGQDLSGILGQLSGPALMSLLQGQESPYPSYGPEGSYGPGLGSILGSLLGGAGAQGLGSFLQNRYGGQGQQGQMPQAPQQQPMPGPQDIGAHPGAGYPEGAIRISPNTVRMPDMTPAEQQINVQNAIAQRRQQGRPDLAARGERMERMRRANHMRALRGEQGAYLQRMAQQNVGRYS